MKTGQFVGAVILSVVFGSLHAFSVLILPLEIAFGAARAGVSFGYALAIASLTAGVYCAPYIMRRIPPGLMSAICGSCAATGVGLAATGLGLGSFLVGYGVVFGFSNGLAYSLFLDRAAGAFAHRQGFALGFVTATYGAGAAAFAPVLGWATERFSIFPTLGLLALVLLTVGVIAALLFSPSGFVIDKSRTTRAPMPRDVLLIWSVYFLAALGGLMTIGHAAPLIESRVPGTTLASSAVLLVALGNIAGSIGGGVWAQRNSQRYALTLPIAVCGFAIASLFAARDETTVLVALCAVGAGYGGLTAAVPVVVLRSAGSQIFASVFGYVFTAWGTAGLIGPTVAGLSFDAFGNYAVPLILALATAIGAFGLALRLPARLENQESELTL